MGASGPVEKGTWASAGDGQLEEGVDADADAGAAGGDGAEEGGEGGSGEEREARRMVTAKLVSLVHRLLL